MSIRLNLGTYNLLSKWMTNQPPEGEKTPELVQGLSMTTRSALNSRLVEDCFAAGVNTVLCLQEVDSDNFNYLSKMHKALFMVTGEEKCSKYAGGGIITNNSKSRFDYYTLPHSEPPTWSFLQSIKNLFSRWFGWSLTDPTIPVIEKWHKSTSKNRKFPLIKVHGIEIISVHLPCNLKDPIQKELYLLMFLHNVKAPTILIGDFNFDVNSCFINILSGIYPNNLAYQSYCKMVKTPISPVKYHVFDSGNESTNIDYYKRYSATVDFAVCNELVMKKFDLIRVSKTPEFMENKFYPNKDHASDHQLIMYELVTKDHDWLTEQQ